MNSPSGQVLTWHESCLQCSDCRDDLNMDNVVFNEKLFCKPCYMNAKLNKCDTCSKVGCSIWKVNYQDLFSRYLQLDLLSGANSGTIPALHVMSVERFFWTESLGI